MTLTEKDDRFTLHKQVENIIVDDVDVEYDYYGDKIHIYIDKLDDMNTYTIPYKIKKVDVSITNGVLFIDLFKKL